MRMRDVTFGIISAYLPPGDIATNTVTLADLSKVFNGMQCPVLVAADFNHTPEELRQAFIPPGSPQHETHPCTIVRGNFLLPDNGSITCYAGQRGSLIDYAITTPMGTRLVKRTRVEYGLPIKTHHGVAHTIVGHPRQLRILKQVRPPKINIVHPTLTPMGMGQMC